MADAQPEPWGRIRIGYSNPAIMRLFALQATLHADATLLGMLPQMVRSGELPFGEGRIQGTLTRRVAKFGDGLIVLVTDVTAQRRTEAELRAYADMVAHDLREPVTSIAHLVTLLRRRGAEPPDPRVLDLMQAGTERARDLIDGVLAYARAGELRRERVALADVMAEVAEDLAPRLRETSATLEVGTLPQVEGDPRQLRRLLQNLTANAVKFRGAQAPRIEVSAVGGADGWIVTVRDNGVGVDPGHAGRIFGMFARGRADTDGTGIGLAICRRVVEAHGGHIWVEPADGGGSAFRFTLPF